MADHAGFCFGVKRAVNGIAEALADNGAGWSIGMPIHNPQEVARLCARGLKIASDVGEIPDGARVFIRAHGEALSVFKELQAKNARVIDMTCPFVRLAAKRARELSAQGYHIVLLGDIRHPEIRAIQGHVDGATDVVADAADVAKLPRMRMAAIISQTTQREELLASVASALIFRTEELHVCNTVCRATVERQDAVRALAGKVDGLVVIGGHESANTAKLRDIGLACGMDVTWIEDINELDGGWLLGKGKIGVAAGASTPLWLITEVCTEIARM